MKIKNEVGNVQLMQKINRLKVLEFIRSECNISRANISKLTGLSPSSVTNIVSHLLEIKLVIETGTIDLGEVGRKATNLRFNYAAYGIISVNIEALKLEIALTDLIGNIFYIKEILFDRLMKDFEILNIIKEETFYLLNHKNKYLDAEIAGMGIAVSGLVKEESEIVLSINMKWKELFLKEQFENIFHLPVYIQNISKSKAIWAIRKYLNEDGKNVVFIDFKTGIGIISIYEHKIIEAVAGEFGHTTVKKDGPLCFCGNRGCLETISSSDYAINECRELLSNGKCIILKEIMYMGEKELNFDTLMEAFNKGDVDVTEVLMECGEYLGIGIANVINVFNPKRIIIDENDMLKSEFVYDIVIKEANKRAFDFFTSNLKFEKVDIKHTEIMQGISLYVVKKLFELSGTIL